MLRSNAVSPFTMSRLFYGSSNVYRNFARSTISSDHGLVLVECTRKAVFDSHITLQGRFQTGTIIVTSVLENFVVDACRDLSDEQVTFFANQQITDHVEALAAVVKDVADSHATVSPLLRRLTPSK